MSNIRSAFSGIRFMISLNLIRSLLLVGMCCEGSSLIVDEIEAGKLINNVGIHQSRDTELCTFV